MLRYASSKSALISKTPSVGTRGEGCSLKKIATIRLLRMKIILFNGSSSVKGLPFQVCLLCKHCFTQVTIFLAAILYIQAMQGSIDLNFISNRSFIFPILSSLFLHLYIQVLEYGLFKDSTVGGQRGDLHDMSQAFLKQFWIVAAAVCIMLLLGTVLAFTLDTMAGDW